MELKINDILAMLPNDTDFEVWYNANFSAVDKLPYAFKDFIKSGFVMARDYTKIKVQNKFFYED